MPEIYSTDLPHVMHEMIDDEVVVVNLESGTYYSIVGVGGQIWSLLGGKGCNMADLVQRVKGMYEGDVEQISTAVAKFVQQLSDEKIINVSSGENTGGASDEPVTAHGTFVCPVLEKYTDMEAMLLVDPIHEVTEDGWPQLK